MYLDVAIAKLIEADHSHNIDVKNDLLEILKKYQFKSAILESFIFLDKIKNNHYHHSLDNLSSKELDKIPSLVKSLCSKMLPIVNQKGLNRNSIYLLEDGVTTPQLPSHYKFDRAILEMMNVKSDLLDKNNLIVPVYSNTIRIFYNIAVIKYLPTNFQIESLLKMNISKFLVNDYFYESIFDDNIFRLKVFRNNKDDSA